MFEVLSAKFSFSFLVVADNRAYERTFAKSAVGDMTKLSLLLDHDIRFCILESSNILAIGQHTGMM